MASRLLIHPRAARLVYGPLTRRPEFRHLSSNLTIGIYYDPALGDAGKQLAQALQPLLQPLYDKVAVLFPGTGRPTVGCVVSELSISSDGSGGAEHDSCNATMLYCDADFGQPERTAALFVAELVEVFEALQAKGWNCGNTNGEALSRCLSQALCADVLDDFSTAAAWLDTPDRPDWINNQQGTDTDPVSVGCGVLFLWWLNTLVGKSWEDIIHAGGNTLAETYYGLGMQFEPYTMFVEECDRRWPRGTPCGVTTDNPWQSPAAADTASLAQLAPGRELVLPGGGRIALAVGLQVLQALLNYFLQQQQPAAPT